MYAGKLKLGRKGIHVRVAVNWLNPKKMVELDEKEDEVDGIMAEVETLAKLTISIWFACWDTAWRTPPIARLRVTCPMGLCMCLSSSTLKAGATTSRSTRVVMNELPSKLHEASTTCRWIVRSKSFIWTCKPSA